MSKRKDGWYQATEKLLYTYPSFHIRIRSLKQQIDVVRQQLEPSMTASYELREGSIYTVSSPVETAVINRIEGDTVRKLETKISNMVVMGEIVESSIHSMLDADQMQLVEYIYFQKHSWQQTCEALTLDKNTYYERKNEIVKVLAWCFGYMPDEDAEGLLGLFMDQALWKGAV